MSSPYEVVNTPNIRLETTAVPTSPVALVTSRPDRDVADDLKRRLREALGPVLQVLDDSRAAGFVPMFNLGLDNLGRSHISELALVKHF